MKRRIGESGRGGNSPGWRHNRTGLAFLDLVRVNRSAELDAAGGPKLIVTTTSGTLTFGAVAVENCI